METSVDRLRLRLGELENLQNIVQEEVEVLRQLNVLEALNPEHFWQGPVIVNADRRNKQTSPFPIDIDCSQNGVSVWVDYSILEEHITDYAGSDADKQKELLRCYIAIGLVYDLAFRALRPEKVEEFSEKITNPHGMLSSLLNTGMIDEEDNFSVVSEFLQGDEDRVARVNMFRFAITVASLAHETEDPGCGERFASMFRYPLQSRINACASYMRLVHERFNIRKEKAIAMYAEHIDPFQLATVLPMTDTELQQFTEIYI